MSENRRYFLLILLLFITLRIFGINIEYENTWKRYTVYTHDSVIIGDYLYINAYCALEIYHIMENGALEMSDVMEFYGLIRSLKYDAEDNMLYILLAGYSESPYSVLAYRLNNNTLDYCFTYETEGHYIAKEWIFPVADYVIIGHNNPTHYYNKLSQSIESLNYNYFNLICSYNDILVEYNPTYHNIKFYQIEDVDNPELLCQFDIRLTNFSRVNFSISSDNLLFLSLSHNIYIFNIENSQNIEFLQTLELPVSDRIMNTIPLNDHRLYINSSVSEKFIYDVTDPAMPEELYFWQEQGINTRACTIYNNRYLYTSNAFDGLGFTDLDDLPDPELETLREYIPFSSNCFYRGMCYKNENGQFYRIDPENGETTLVCELPISIGWYYYPDDNYIYISGTYGYNTYLSIIDIDADQLVYHEILNDQLYTVHNGKIFVKENENTVNVFQLNANYELEFCSSITVSGSVRFSGFDEIYIWISDSSGEMLYNTETLEIEVDYGDVLSPDPDMFTVPYKYGNRLLLSNMDSSNSVEIKLYDISDLANPVLLDEKNENEVIYYFSLEDYLLEIRDSKDIYVYERFSDSFTEPIQEFDLDTMIFDLVVDEEQQRIGLSSFYFLRTFLYENTGNGLQIIPEINNSLSCYPNPFNPETTISYSTNGDPENTEINIYNVKGQCVRELNINDAILNKGDGRSSVVWDGRDDMGNQVSCGVYFISLEVNERRSAINKCLLLK